MAERNGIYQVWHRNGAVFRKVAEVKAGNMLAALVLTMNRKDRPWQDNTQVTAFVESTRSTDMGDRIVDPDGIVYGIEDDGAGAGFREIGVDAELKAHGHLTLAGLREEILADAAAGKCEDAHWPGRYGHGLKEVLGNKTEPGKSVLGKDRSLDR